MSCKNCNDCSVLLVFQHIESLEMDFIRCSECSLKQDSVVKKSRLVEIMCEKFTMGYRIVINSRKHPTLYARLFEEVKDIYDENTLSELFLVFN